MLTQETLVDIHVLHRQGSSIRAIAKELGVSHNTVRRYLRDLTAAPIYPNRARRPTKLEPYKAYLARIQSRHLRTLLRARAPGRLAHRPPHRNLSVLLRCPAGSAVQ